MKKKTDVFDNLDNVIGNYQDNHATLDHVLSVACEVNQYLLKHPHPHDYVLGDVWQLKEGEFICAACGKELDEDNFMHRKNRRLTCVGCV